MTIIRHLCIAIMTVIVVTHAAVLTHQETFNDVKVISPAKSTQTICKTRVDLSEGLVDNTLGCDIEEILVYNKNRMWIGSLDGVEAGDNCRYADYDVARYKGKGTQIGIVYSFTPQDADPSNRWMVSCPKGMIAYIEEDYYRCKNTYSCPDGMYATDSTECEELPSDAHRNKSTGFTCNKGYVLRDGYCEEITQCAVEEVYVSNTNTCASHPDHAHWVNKKELIWACDNGYWGNSYSCKEIVSCSDGELYDSTTNRCEFHPAHAHWVDSSSFTWECDNGYWLNDYNSCEEQVKCEPGRFNDTDNSCYENPANSHWAYTSGPTWECNDGYVRINDHCEVKANCEHYNFIDNSCYEKPEHSYWINTSGSGWECDAGWWNNGDYCEEQVSCGWFERYNADNNTCVTKPPHSHWISEGSDYACDYGYTYDNHGECYETNPVHLSDYVHIAHDIGVDAGGRTLNDTHNDTQLILNIGADYNAGASFGNENINIRLQGTIALLYTTFHYNNRETDHSLDALLLLYGLNTGIDLWRITFDYSYLLIQQGGVNNTEFSSAIHRLRGGIKLDDHWLIHLTVIPKLIEHTTVLKDYHVAWFHIGITYRF